MRHNGRPAPSFHSRVLDEMRRQYRAPVVDVAIVPADPDAAQGPIVDVALEPASIVVPLKQQDLSLDQGRLRCDICGTRAAFHFDGFTGSRLSCREAQRRHGVL